jgi:hypothetical protein
MSKLQLNLGDLHVDSFDPDVMNAEPGTVQGQTFGRDTLDADCFTNNNTICIDSCGGTCIENGCGLETVYICD